MLFQLEDHKLFEETISHHELLSGTGNVSVVVENTHTGETGSLNLDSYMSSDIELHVSLGSGEGTDRLSGREVVETLVSDFIDHFVYLLLIIIFSLIFNTLS